jgi:hypothetical protein
MPLVYDEEYQSEVELAIEQARARGTLYWRISFLLSALVLFGFPFILGQLNLDDVLRA